MPSFLSSVPAQSPKSEASISKALGLACLHSLVHSFERKLHRHRSVRNDLLENCFGSSDQIGSGNHLVDEPDAIGFLGIDDLAGENELQCAPFSDQSWQTLRSSATRA